MSEKLILKNNHLYDENDRLRTENAELRRISASAESKIQLEMSTELMAELAPLQIVELKEKLKKHDENYANNDSGSRSDDSDVIAIED
ncbi:hypothetical protein Bhyg_14440 [Pseudolycoriella hygida]|uniref:Uncharacterized protein n=1 Tax=Pseudolycoriella hygida TaxID=35572 RepID=A0A9Q0MRZ5_9DIPT|nr:hypothetical protein Bhyg_14440 [Pseudolycoriella hygida]